MTLAHEAGDLNYRQLFRAVPGRYLVLDPAYTVIAVSDAFLALTGIDRSDILGHHLFDVSPLSQGDPSFARMGDLLHASLDRVRAELVVDTMPVQRHDVRRPDHEGGGLEIRHWSPVSSPVLDGDGTLLCIIHWIDDVTEAVLYKTAAKKEHDAAVVLQQVGEQIHAREVCQTEALTLANAELRKAGEVLDETVKERTKELRASLEDLNVVNAKYLKLLHRMVTVQEEAAHRIANDIHDDTLQSIIVAQMRLQMLSSKTAGTPVAGELERVGSAVGDAVSRLRRLMFQLRPDDLNQGVATVLLRQLDDIVAVSAITAGLTTEWTSEPKGVEQVTLYRVAREALVNIRKHVADGHVAVALREQDHGWAICIQDHGPGFTASDGLAWSGHLGLTTMRERAESLGGWWRIESERGSGTTVEFWVPGPSEPAGATLTEWP